MHLMGVRELAKMRPFEAFIYTARAGVAHDMALVKVLKRGVIAAAGLDAFGNEPVFHPAFAPLDHVVLTPLLTSSTARYRQRAVTGKPPHLFNS